MFSNFPGSLVLRLLVKGNKDSRDDTALTYIKTVAILLPMPILKIADVSVCHENKKKIE